MNKQYPVSGAGLGFRRELIDQLDEQGASGIDFMEVAPENWIGVGGKFGKSLRRYTEQIPFVIHGLSLSIGSPAPLDEELVYEAIIPMQEELCHEIRRRHKEKSK